MENRLNLVARPLPGNGPLGERDQGSGLARVLLDQQVPSCRPQPALAGPGALGDEPKS